MRRLVLLFLCVLCTTVACSAQPSGADREPIYPTYSAFQDALETIVATPDATRRDSLLDVFWADLKAARQVPFAVGDSVAFLYRGAASSVAWNGDFNRWGGDTSFANKGTRLGDTDLWVLEHTFPSQARLDYKIVVGSDWRLDPNNPFQQWSGFGPNSELRMPDYEYPTETIARPDIAPGILHDPLVLQSDALGYGVQYRVYTPAGYDSLSNLPTLYVTDGHEYADDRLGSLVIVLDNLIADGVISPILAVFVDPRAPGAPGTNRRQSQYADAYDTFAAFMADELVPAIDATYKTNPSADERGILGTSLGGLFSAYLGATHPDVFRRIGIHSPAFWYDQQRSGDTIYTLYTQQDRLPLDIFMSTGTINDTRAGARRMKAVFEDKAYPLHYVEVPEGHSWGNWRAQLAAPLMQFWGTGTVLGSDEASQPENRFALHSYPNPSRGAATISFQLAHTQRVSLDVYNVIGRRIATVLADKTLPPGSHGIAVEARQWPNGVYLYRLTGEAAQAVGQMTLVR